MVFGISTAGINTRVIRAPPVIDGDHWGGNAQAVRQKHECAAAHDIAEAELSVVVGAADIDEAGARHQRSEHSSF